MKKLTANELKGYLESLIMLEDNEAKFYENCMKDYEEGTPQHESFKGHYYGHIHCQKLIYDIIKLVDKLED